MVCTYLPYKNYINKFTGDGLSEDEIKVLNGFWIDDLMCRLMFAKEQEHIWMCALFRKKTVHVRLTYNDSFINSCSTLTPLTSSIRFFVI